MTCYEKTKYTELKLENNTSLSSFPATTPQKLQEKSSRPLKASQYDGTLETLTQFNFQWRLQCKYLLISTLSDLSHRNSLLNHTSGYIFTS